MTCAIGFTCRKPEARSHASERRESIHGVSGRNFPRFRCPASRGKPVICNPLQIPLSAYAEPSFARSGT